ncbi:MAG: 30S ribosomal protein S17 [Candidatus Woesearchaeota archaeon]
MAEEACKDRHCSRHGGLSVRGRRFVGTVISANMQRTATVEWPRTKFIRKYERYARARSRVKAHNPDCIAAKPGDVVRIGECRKISKTKSFVILEKISSALPVELQQRAEKESKKIEAVGEEK